MNKRSNDATGWYGNVFKHWPVKLVGPQPSAAQLDTIHKLGARPGKQALANAMGLRDAGVTGAQIVMACGAPQLNKMRGFVADGLLKFEAVPPADNGHKVYKLLLTAKGQAKVDRVTKAQAEATANTATPGAASKPAKPARKRKAVTAQPTVTAEAAEANAATVTAQPQPQAEAPQQA